MTTRQPTTEVLAAFGCNEVPKPLEGEEGRAFRCGRVVLKQAEVAVEAEWSARVLSAVSPAGVRVPRPIASPDGRYIIDGWACEEFIPARHVPGRWLDIIAAGRVVHESLADVTRPDWMYSSWSRWQLANAIAWGEESPGVIALADLVDRLLAIRRPLELPQQVVHGDLCGNVLFDNDDVPVIIDFSPYWRPPEWASAIVCIDAFEWEGAGLRALTWIGHDERAQQLLVRAALFRVVLSAQSSERRSDAHRAAVEAVHRRTVEALEKW